MAERAGEESESQDQSPVQPGGQGDAATSDEGKCVQVPGLAQSSRCFAEWVSLRYLVISFPSKV